MTYLSDRSDRHHDARRTAHLSHFCALGQFEPDIIRERTRAGLDAAMARALAQTASEHIEGLH